MTIQLVGAGLGRTGTHSLKLALEHLLGGTSHHMMEVNDDQAPTWRDAFTGTPPDWQQFLEPYCAIVDWPGAGLWREIAAAFPDAPVLLSTRASAEVWYESASNTIFKAMDTTPVNDAGAQAPFLTALMASFCDPWGGPAALMAAYEAHNAAVREAIPVDRLFEYQPGDGWGPLCAALQLPEPDIDFPRSNSTAEFQQRMQSREPAIENQDDS